MEPCPLSQFLRGPVNWQLSCEHILWLTFRPRPRIRSSNYSFSLKSSLQSDQVVFFMSYFCRILLRSQKVFVGQMTTQPCSHPNAGRDPISGRVSLIGFSSKKILGYQEQSIEFLVKCSPIRDRDGIKHLMEDGLETRARQHHGLGHRDEAEGAGGSLSEPDTCLGGQ